MNRLIILMLAIAPAVFSLKATPCMAQQNTALGCMDASIRTQAEAIKDHYKKQGFEVFRDAMFTMERDQKIPVVITLSENTVYEIIFVAHPRFKSMKLSALDEQDIPMKVLEGVANRDQPNYLIYSFTPRKTESFLFLPEQNTKMETMCGAFFILKLDPKKAGTEIVHYTAGQ